MRRLRPNKQHLISRLKERKRKRNRAIFEASNRAKSNALKVKLTKYQEIRFVPIFIDLLGG